ncbi:TATA box-binding protein-like protein 1 [Lingula anatina]|uniref:TATA box-binding protein-like 1 n=1 Tax=Lingula anatina TaxID=7574 RepID=A0A1S3HRE0_LINAN|nr:TATA box-binding protein-like protein 1 [Lingula anatina]|eukprot:XP_013388598.1 TATA box-binding protein-like protein 1 [Lingula anatina]
MAYRNMVSMKIRHPKATASIWSSGKITCTGATSEEEAKKAGRKVARALQKLGFNVKFASFRVVNVLATCILPFAIRIQTFSDENRNNASYEPELHPGVTYKIKDPKATLKVFSTGSITVTAPRVSNVQSAIEHVYPLVYEHKMYKPPSSVKTLPEAAVEVSGPTKIKRKKPKITKSIDLDEEDECSSFESSGDESFSSDASFD